MYNPKLAVQTSIWLSEMQSRNVALRDGLEQIFAGIDRAGYRRVELMPEFLEPQVREKTLGLLQRYKLEPAIIYASGPLHDHNAAGRSRNEVLETALIMRSAGAGFVNFRVAPKPDRQPKTDSELETQAYQLNRMGRDLFDVGLRLLLHHHTSEMRDNAREWRYCVKYTETALVSFSLDIEWVFRSGLRPVDLMNETAGRLGSLHVRNSRRGMPLETVSDGDIDLIQVANHLRQMFYEGFLVVDLRYDHGVKRAHSLPTDFSLSRMYMQKVFGERPGSMPVDMGPHVRTKEL
jgi:inosose dehydratase